jgi:hypothetical protein
MNQSFSTKARRFTRRLSYGISKIFRASGEFLKRFLCVQFSNCEIIFKRVRFQTEQMSTIKLNTRSIRMIHNFHTTSTNYVNKPGSRGVKSSLFIEISSW